MRLTLVASALVLMASTAYADNTFTPRSNAGSMISQIEKNQVQPTPKNLFELAREINNEDQRLTDGTFDAATGTLKLYTQDMVAGNDGDISRREVTVTGFEALKGAQGVQGEQGIQGVQGEKGDTGAQGEQGIQGVQGEQGIQGVQGEKGDTGAQGEQGVAGADGKDGRDGVDGVDGKDGVDGRDGRDADTSVIEAQAAAAQDELNQRLRDMEKRAMQNDAAVAGLGGLELRQGGEGVTSWSLGLGGISNGGYTEGAIAAGIHYGIADNMGVYGKISKSFDGDAVAGFIGIEGQF